VIRPIHGRAGLAGNSISSAINAQGMAKGPGKEGIYADPSASVVGTRVSGMVTGPARFTRALNKVMLEGAAAAYPTCPLGGHGTSANSKGVHDQASQAEVRVSG
jgi:hypothetical protein